MGVRKRRRRKKKGRRSRERGGKTKLWLLWLPGTCSSGVIGGMWEIQRKRQLKPVGVGHILHLHPGR